MLLSSPPPYILYPNIIQLETSRYLANLIEQNTNEQHLLQYLTSEEMLLFGYWLTILENAHNYEAKMMVPDKYEYSIRYLMTKGNIYRLYPIIDRTKLVGERKKNSLDLFNMYGHDLWKRVYNNRTIGYRLVNPHHLISKEEFDKLYNINILDDGTEINHYSD